MATLKRPRQLGNRDHLLAEERALAAELFSLSSQDTPEASSAHSSSRSTARDHSPQRLHEDAKKERQSKRDKSSSHSVNQLASKRLKDKFIASESASESDSDDTDRKLRKRTTANSDEAHSDENSNSESSSQQNSSNEDDDDHSRHADDDSDDSEISEEESNSLDDDRSESGEMGKLSLLRTKTFVDSDQDMSSDSESLEPKQKRRRIMTPAWHDNDDETLTVNLMNKERRRKLRQSTSETTLSGGTYRERLAAQRDQLALNDSSWAVKQKEDDVDILLASTRSLYSKSNKTRLEPGHLLLSRLVDANIKERSQAVIQSVDFHPGGEILLTAGLDKSLRLFACDGIENEKLQSIFLPKFTPSGTEVFICGPRKSFHVYDIDSGNVDRINLLGSRPDLGKLLSLMVISPDNEYVAFFTNMGKIVVILRSSRHVIADFSPPSHVYSLSFTADSTAVISIGAGGDVFEWDIGMQRCRRRYADYGSLKSTALSISPSGEYQAIGSESGVVNLYKLDQDFEKSAGPMPAKEIMNLRTPVNLAVFNHDSQIMLISSDQKRNAVRFVHLPSYTVYKNFPKDTTPIGRLSAAAFSPDSTKIALGNAKGKVLLYKLHHYASQQ